MLVDHGGLADYLTWAARMYVRGDHLSFPLFTSLSFDLTVTSLFLPLITGGTLVVYPEPDGPVDSALMVIDRVKGVETQTEKLMEVCRMRNTPVITFINKLDREGMTPLDLLSDIEEKLQIECAPLAWPIGMGKSFKGVYNLYRKQVNLFTPGAETRHQEVVALDDGVSRVADGGVDGEDEHRRRMKLHGSNSKPQFRGRRGNGLVSAAGAWAPPPPESRALRGRRRRGPHSRATCRGPSRPRPAPPASAWPPPSWRRSRPTSPR